MEIEIIETNENCCCRCKGHGKECEKFAWIYCDLRHENEEKFNGDCGENLGCNYFSEKTEKVCNCGLKESEHNVRHPFVENKQTITRTKGNVIVEKIKVGDIHYEFELGCGIKCEVLELPKLNSDGNYVWVSKNTISGNIIRYLVNPKYPHYAPNLYDYEAYKVETWI